MNDSESEFTQRAQELYPEYKWAAVYPFEWDGMWCLCNNGKRFYSTMIDVVKMPQLDLDTVIHVMASNFNYYIQTEEHINES